MAGGRASAICPRDESHFSGSGGKQVGGAWEHFKENCKPVFLDGRERDERDEQVISLSSNSRSFGSQQSCKRGPRRGDKGTTYKGSQNPYLTRPNLMRARLLVRNLIYYFNIEYFKNSNTIFMGFTYLLELSFSRHIHFAFAVHWPVLAALKQSTPLTMWQKGGQLALPHVNIFADKSDKPNSFAADSHSEADLMKSQDVALSSITLYSVIQSIICLQMPYSPPKNNN